MPTLSSPSAPPPDLLLRSALTTSGDRVDVALHAGKVEAVRPAGSAAELTGAEVIDLDGYLLVPAPAEPHTHLDKALTWDRLATGHVDLTGALAAWGRASSRLDLDETRERALRAVADLVAHGVTAVRTHADVCPGERPLAAVEALVGLRERLTGLVPVQVAFLCRPDTPDEVVRAAVDAGIDIVGGAPFMGPDPAADNARLLALAEAAGVRLDLHVDEDLDASHVSLADLARRVLERGFRHDVTASHCISLGVQAPDEVARAVDLVARAGLRVVTLPLTNLYLMGRGHEGSPPRALTAIRRLLDAGVTVAAGSDNIRDPFNPMGRADPLAIASLLVTAAHLTVAEAYHAVSTAAREVLGLPPAGPTPGLAADLLAVRAGSLDDAVARTPDDRLVFADGRLVASTETRRQSVLG
jgi:cytosine deaminase